jgi:hypothetical protein
MGVQELGMNFLQVCSAETCDGSRDSCKSGFDSRPALHFTISIRALQSGNKTYSWRRARIGSAVDARYAGMTAAMAAASSNAPALNAIVAGSADVVS